ncbi:MAG: GGDEF domain-containing protein, partial [Rubrivivax sp.]|nr:GGDEF domain-containing protein [Rubrivivax sp.]
TATGEAGAAAAQALQTALSVAGLRASLGADGIAARGHDAVLLSGADAAALHALAAQPALTQTAFDSAVLVIAQQPDLAAELALLKRGVQAVLTAADAALPGALVRAIAHAVARKRLERAGRNAYATDLATGLPHQAQLVEHMTQLLALREREPAPMVLLVLRIDGFLQAAARLGSEAGNVLRRKVAVRLRSGLRASDVVAAIGPDAFGVLLGRLEAKGDGERVAAKLVQALTLPIAVAGRTCPLQASVGMAIYPEHGKDAESLLQRASAQAGSVATLGRAGYAAPVVRIGGAAANDDDR